MTSVTFRPVSRGGLGRRDVAVGGAACLMAVALGVEAAQNLALALGLTAALIYLPVFVLRAEGRIAATVVGGLLVFQSNNSLSAAKFGYLGIVIAGGFLSLLELHESTTPEFMLGPVRLLKRAALFMTAVQLLALAAGLSTGTPAKTCIRDSVPYLMLLLLLPIAVDAGLHASRRALLALLLATGGAAAIGFAVDWLSRREVSALSVGKFSLSSVSLIALPLAYALARGGSGRPKISWLVYSMILWFSVLVTGTRAGLLFAVVFFGLYGQAKRRGIPLHNQFLIGLGIALAGAVFVPAAIGSLSTNAAGVGSRLGDLSVKYLGRDASFQERRFQYQLAESEFASHPWMGTGPGFSYSSLGPDGAAIEGTQLDTPVVTLARLGAIGTVLLMSGLVYVLLAVRMLNRHSASHAGVAARGFATIFVAQLPLGDLVEEKGFALALALLLALVVAEVQASRTKSERTSSDSASLA